jgi:hypothetical protein
MGQKMRKPNEKLGLQRGFMCHYTCPVNTDDETHKMTVMVGRCEGRYLSRDHPHRELGNHAINGCEQKYRRDLSAWMMKVASDGVCD